MSYDGTRITSSNAVGRDVFCDSAIHANYGVVANTHTFQDCDACSQPYVIFDDNRARSTHSCVVKMKVTIHYNAVGANSNIVADGYAVPTVDGCRAHAHIATNQKRCLRCVGSDDALVVYADTIPIRRGVEVTALSDVNRGVGKPKEGCPSPKVGVLA